MPPLDERIGLSVSSTKIQLVEIGIQDGNKCLNNVEEAVYTTSLNFSADKEIVLLNNLQSAFDKLSAKDRLVNRQVSISLPPEFFYSFTVPADQTLVKQDLIDNFRWELSVLYPFITAEDYSINFYEIQKVNGNNSSERRVIVFALSRKIINLFLTVCKRYNLGIKLIDHAHFSADKSILLNRPELMNASIITVCVSNGYFSLEYLHNGKPQYFIGHQFASPSEFLTKLSEDLDFMNSEELNLSKLENFFLVGDSISEPMLNSVRQATRYPFQALNPFAGLVLGTGGINKEFLHTKNFTFNSAAGLCYRLV